MFKRYTSPNFGPRKGFDAPQMLILHYTGMREAKTALERLCDAKSEVSAHYVIEETGKIHGLVADEMRAWHAGAAHWAGESDINSASIGIELVNPGHEYGYCTFPEKQIETLEGLCQKLIKTYNIKPDKVLGHSDVAISRKIDPGHLFPWERLARSGIGLWPAPQEMDYQAAEDLIVNPGALHELLVSYGYSGDARFEEVVVAFHRHFYPEKFDAWDDQPDEPDVLSCAKLLSLIRQAHEA